MVYVPIQYLMPVYWSSKELFGQAAVAISQTAVKLKVGVNDATNGFLLVTDVAQPNSGSVVGVTITLNTNKTAGLLQVSPTINGSEVGSGVPLYRVAMANSAKVKSLFSGASVSGQTFAAGDTVGAM